MDNDADAVKLSWEFSRVARGGPGGTRLIVMTRLSARGCEGYKRAPLNVSLVLDTSGSMEGDKIQQCQHAARYAVSQLSPADKGSVVAFSHDVKVITPHGPILDKDEVMRKILGLKADGWTNLSGGWLEGAALVEKAMAPAQVNRVVLLTDGDATHGVKDPERLRQIARELAHKGIQTTAVGFGSDINEDLLRGLADDGGGNFHFIESPEQASTVFAREFSELLSTVAQNVRLRILPPADIAAVGLLQNLPAQAIPGGWEVSLGDLLDGDEKNILMELQIPPGFSGREIATLQLSYQQVIEPIAFRELSVLVESPSQNVPAWLQGLPVNPLVWREVLLSRVIRELREARDEADTGKLAEARKRLGEARKELEASEFRGDPTFTEQSHELRRLEEMLSTREDYESLGRKSLSSYEASSARSKVYTKGGILEPALRKSLFVSKTVVFVTARDLALEAGLPDPTLAEFEGLPYDTLARKSQTSQQEAQQWRWVTARQQAIEALSGGVHRLIPAFQFRWPTTALITTATDGLHPRSSDMETVELYGSLWRGRCSECERVHELQGLVEKEGVPLGPCGHPLRPNVIWPGEQMLRAPLKRAEELMAQADALIFLGGAAEGQVASSLAPTPKGQIRLVIGQGARPPWADGHIPQAVEMGLRTLARETSTVLG